MKEPFPYIRKFNMYGILVCGLISISIGVCMNLNGKVGYGGLRYRHFHVISGGSAIIIGIIISIFPAYVIIRKSFYKK